MDSVIFRQYDIRGIVYQDFQPKDFYKIAQGFCSLFENIDNKTVAIGMDARLHSNEIKENLTKGIIESGFNVIDLGTVSTPMTVFASKHLKTELAIMITASHNPKEYNGAKFFLNQKQFFGENITMRLKDASLNRNFQKNPTGSYYQFDISEIYADYILNKFNFSQTKKLKVAFDCGNSVGSVGLGKILPKLSFETHVLFGEIDGNFPNHHPDPSKESNMLDLKDFILKNSYDIGFAFDGDADRVGVVLKNGKILSGEELFYVISKYLLKQGKKDFVVDVLTSHVIIKRLEKDGAKVILSQVGNGFISQKMRETNSTLGIEMSGHICIKDRMHMGNDDAIFNALYILDIFMNTDIESTLKEIKNLSSTTNQKHKVSESQKDVILKNIISEIKEIYPACNTIDGCRVEFENGFFCVRKSNTENIIMLKTENLDILTKNQLEAIFRKYIVE